MPLPPVGGAGAIPVLPVRNEPEGFVIQLGAFANYLNAQAFIAHVQNQIAGLNVEARVHESAGLFRVVVGPYATREDARRGADRLRESIGVAGTIRSQ
jgi:rare lipoprotein A